MRYSPDNTFSHATNLPVLPDTTGENNTHTAWLWGKKSLNFQRLFTIR